MTNLSSLSKAVCCRTPRSATETTFGWHGCTCDGPPTTRPCARWSRAFDGSHHGALDKYHHTLTVVWMRLVAAAKAIDGSRDFDGFLGAHPELLDKTTPQRFYSAARLGSQEARTTWLDPDVYPLPLSDA
jgi:hypothetical protein